MKIIKNNYNNSKSTLTLFTKQIVECEECGSQIEVEVDDLEIGQYGLKYVKCPCCGKKTFNDEFGDITLNIDNLNFPQHYSNFSIEDGAIDVSDEEINSMVKECISHFTNDENDTYRFIETGNVFIMVYRWSLDEEYQIIVCKNFHETYIPLD